jgi:hypothetical protein
VSDGGGCTASLLGFCAETERSALGRQAFIDAETISPGKLRGLQGRAANSFPEHRPDSMACIYMGSGKNTRSQQFAPRELPVSLMSYPRTKCWSLGLFEISAGER